jgi:hypothetical protein
MSSSVWTEGLGSWCPEPEKERVIERRELLPRGRTLPIPVAYQFGRRADDVLKLQVASAGSRLEILGLWLMQLAVTLGFVEALVHRQVVAPRILIGLFIVGVTYWITIFEMRRKARADLGI